LYDFSEYAIVIDTRFLTRRRLLQTDAGVRFELKPEPVRVGLPSALDVRSVHKVKFIIQSPLAGSGSIRTILLSHLKRFAFYNPRTSEEKRYSFWPEERTMVRTAGMSDAVAARPMA
jgi:hypothetical protein